MDEKELQQKYMEYKVLEQQIKQIQEQIQLVDNQVMEIKVVQKNLKDVSGIKEGTEILVPVANGIFARGTIGKSEKLLVNVGSNIIVNKTVKQTEELLDKQITEISNLREELVGNYTSVDKSISQMESELKKLTM